MSTARRVGAVALALMVVLAGVGIAEQRGHDVAPVEEAEGAVVLAATALTLGAGIGVAVASEYLGGQGGISKEAHHAVLQGETQQQKVDMAVGLLSMHQKTESYLTTRANLRQDASAVASMKAKARLAEEINNGTTNVATLSNRVNNTIENYYARQQVNLKRDLNTSIWHVGTVVQSSYEDENMTMESVVGVDNAIGSDDIFISMWVYQKPDRETTTLVNGTVVNVSTIKVDYGPGNYNTDPTYGFNNFSYSGGGTEYRIDDSVQSYEAPYQFDLAKQSTGNQTKDIPNNQEVLDVKDYMIEWQALEDQTATVKSNYGDPTFIQGIVDSYEAGEINTSELVSPEILANEWGTAYNQTGDSTYQWATFAALGVEMPDLNKTAAMRVEYVKPYNVRHVELNVTNSDGTLSDGTPYYVTISRPDGSTTKKVIVNQSGAVQNATFEVPVGDGAQVADYQFLFSSPNAGKSVDWQFGGFSTSFQGVDVATVEKQNRTVSEWGMLFASESPSEGWNTSGMFPDREVPAVDPTSGVYDPANRGSVYFAERGGKMHLVDQPFEIVLIQDDEGKNLSSVETRDYNKQTTSTENFTKQLRQLEQLREEVEVRAEPAGTGIGFPDIGGLAGGIGGVIVLGVAAILIFGRN